AVDAAVGRHYRPDAGPDGRDVPGQMDLAQVRVRQTDVALIVGEMPALLLRIRNPRAVDRAAVGEEVLRARQHAQRRFQVLTLQAVHGRFAQLRGQRRVLTEAFLST